jgi:hypothetical protein
MYIENAHVVFVTGGMDWQGLYINGVLEFQDHSIPMSDVLALLVGKHVASFKEVEYDLDWMETESYLPSNLSEVKVYSND